jgi:phage gp29-like protein
VNAPNTPSALVRAANRWRSQYNPLRGLTIQRAVSLLEAAADGRYADAQWTFQLAEKRWPVLAALVERRLGAIGKLDWNIKPTGDRRPKTEIGNRAVLRNGGPGSGRYPKGSGGGEGDEALSPAPALSSIADADTRLDAGFRVRNPSGADVKFGARAKRYIETKADGQPRWLPHRRTTGMSAANDTLARRQAEYLRAAYERIENLREAIRFLALASFRGYAHLEILRDNAGQITRLEPVPQWHWGREGDYGDWTYDAESRDTNAATARTAIARENFIIREVDRPLHGLALALFLKAGLCDKDWDGFIEIYGLPKPVVIMPPNVPAGKETEYRDGAEKVADGQAGSLPAGSDVKYPSETRATHPFKERLDWIAEQLVLAGTGGKLTMLSAPTGIGQGASEQQADVFADIAAAEALAISECFQRDLDKQLLAAAFPGAPVLAYFELAAPDVEDISAIVAHALQLAQAGYVMDAAELSERTGYRIEKAEVRSQEPEVRIPTADPPLSNRVWSWLKQRFTGETPTAGEPPALQQRVEALARVADPDEFRRQLRALRAEIVALPLDAGAAAALEDAMARALVNALEEETP